MLGPDERASLDELIQPPSHAEITHVVGSTCSLDTTSALRLPIAVSDNPELSHSEPVDVLTALRLTADKIDIFHQVGRIPMPHEPTALVTLLEESLHGVHQPGAIFRPTMFLARYEHRDGTIGMRLLVLTRDFTTERSWDVVVVLDGYVTTRPFAVNRPLSTLLGHVPGVAVVPLPRPRKTRLSRLADEIRYVQWTAPPAFSEVSFHLLGVRGSRSAPNFSGRRHLIISPFPDADGIRHVLSNSATGDMTVVSTARAIHHLCDDTDLANTRWFTLDPSIDASDAGVGLRTRLYCVHRERGAQWYVGSADANAHAFRGDVEFLIGLRGGRSVGIDALLAEDGLGKLLRPYDADVFADDTEEHPGRDDDPTAFDMVSEIACIPLSVAIVRNGASWQMNVTSKAALPETTWTIRIAPLTRPELVTTVPSGHAVSASFTGLGAADTSAFLTVHVVDDDGAHATSVVKAQVTKWLRGLGDVIDPVVRTQRELVRLLRNLLFDADQDSGTATPIAEQTSATREDGLFELLLHTAARRPERFEKVRDVVDALSREKADLLPDGFDQLWSALVAAMGEDVRR